MLWAVGSTLTAAAGIPTLYLSRLDGSGWMPGARHAKVVSSNCLVRTHLSQKNENQAKGPGSRRRDSLLEQKIMLLST